MHWNADILGAPYEQATIPLQADDRGELVATLVRRRAPRPNGAAVLHVHGFADYFFQTGAADFWTARGYDFYALDLRRYGRSLREHQLANYTADLHEYDEELDLAWTEVSASHDRVILSAHSTGGLTVPLWLDDRGHQVAGVFLNAPWLDMVGDAFTRQIAMPAVHRVGSRQPERQIPRKVSGRYGRSLHRDFSGEWDYNLAWKPEMSWPIYAGWIRAIRLGQARVRRGLDVQGPVLVLCSDRTGQPPTDDHPDTSSTDLVLNVEQIRRRAPLLGRQVTVSMVPGALHDVTLSPEPARSRVFDQLERWLVGYVER